MLGRARIYNFLSCLLFCYLSDLKAISTTAEFSFQFANEPKNYLIYFNFFLSIINYTNNECEIIFNLQIELKFIPSGHSPGNYHTVHILYICLRPQLAQIIKLHEHCFLTKLFLQLPRLCYSSYHPLLSTNIIAYLQQDNKGKLHYLLPTLHLLVQTLLFSLLKFISPSPKSQSLKSHLGNDYKLPLFSTHLDLSRQLFDHFPPYLQNH